ncbi:unnamed protein product, partial [marine sediment metagenome]
MDKTSEKERINEMIDTIMKVARGDYSVRVELSGQNDEFDSLAMGLNMMIDDVRTSTEDLDRQRKELSTLNKHLQQEIAERKRAGEALKESEERYRALFRANADGVLIADSQIRKIVFANPVIC